MNTTVAIFLKTRNRNTIRKFLLPVLLIGGLVGLVIGFSAQSLFAQEAASTWASNSPDSLCSLGHVSPGSLKIGSNRLVDVPDCIASRYPGWADTQPILPRMLQPPIEQSDQVLPTPTPFAYAPTMPQDDVWSKQIIDSSLNAASIASNGSRGGEDDGSVPTDYRSPANFSQGFDDVTLLPGQEWFFRNNSSPTGSNNWFQGINEVFTAHAGAANAYIAASFNNTAGTGTISNWMLTPVVTLANGNSFSFWTRTPGGSTWPDRLELRLSTAGASTNVGSTASSVGDFSTLLLSVNPSLAQGGYPESWTRYSVTLAGIPGGATGRIAFRYYVTDGGPDGANSNYIGIDTVEYTGSLANFSCSNVTQIPQNECQALVALYNSTDGSGWTDKSGWLVSNTPCSWYGVNCDAGHVFELNLSQNQLAGTVPTSIGNLNRMVWLGLHGNSLTGNIPSTIGGLTSLQFLRLWGNQLSGSIPPEIGNLTNLRAIHGWSNQLSGSMPSQLGNLINLNHLWLDRNQLSGSIPSSLGNLSSLQGLNLSDNQLSGNIPIQMGNLSNLLYLSLAENQLSGSIPSQLDSLTNLQVLNLSFNQLSGSIPFQLGNLISLQELYLSSNQLTGNIPSQLGNLANLQFLLLSFNQLTGSIPFQLSNLTNLRGISLWNNQLGGNIPPQLGTLANIEYLDLEGNQLTGTIPSQFGNLTNLLYLYLDRNQLAGDIPVGLGNLTNAQYLGLSRNQLRGSVPSQLCNLNSLAEGDLDLGFNGLVAGPACISSKDPDWATTQTVPPTGLQATAQSPNQVGLTWTPILYSEDGGYYEISYAISSGGPFTVHGTTANKSASSYVVTGLAPGTTHYFRVRTHTPAHGDQQNNLWSDYSATVSSTTGSASWSQYLPLVLYRFAPVPGAPVLSAITPPGANPSYNINWSPATSATSYLLQRATNASFTDATQVYTGASTGYSAPSQGIARYFYRVQARNQWGSSPWSNVQSVDVRWEQEPNNASSVANGPLASAMNYYGFPNDASDYFFFQTTRRGQITIDLNNHTGQGIQLLLYYPEGNQVDRDITPPYRLEYTGDPGRYYVRIYSTDGFNSTTPYSLRAVLP